MDGQVGFGSILQRAAALVARDPAGIIGGFAGLVLLATAIDSISGNGGSAGNIPLGFASLFAQYEITRRQLRRAELVQTAGRERILPLLGMLIVTGIGIALGSILLVVPGLFLAARWSIATPILVGEGTGVFDAIGESWRRTAPHTGAIMALMLLIVLPYLVAIGITIAFGDAAGGTSFAVQALSNAIIYATMIFLWLVAVAIYLSLARPAAERLDDVFA